MTPETLTALKASIAHHEENLKAETPWRVSMGPKQCALCKIHRKETLGSVTCNGCPVKKRTGLDACDGSPFERLWDAFCDWCNTESEDNKSAFLTAERAEIAFLRSLLPEGHA